MPTLTPFVRRQTHDETIMKKETLEYLAQRLEAVAMGEFCEAAGLVRKVLASSSPALHQPEAEYALYNAVWDQITRAIAMKDYTPADEEKVYALEAEVHGKILKYQLTPPPYRGIDEFLRSSVEQQPPAEFEMSEKGVVAVFCSLFLFLISGVPAALVFLYREESVFWPLHSIIGFFPAGALFALYMIRLKYKADRRYYNSQHQQDGAHK